MKGPGILAGGCVVPQIDAAQEAAEIGHRHVVRHPPRFSVRCTIRPLGRRIFECCSDLLSYDLSFSNEMFDESHLHSIAKCQRRRSGSKYSHLLCAFRAGLLPRPIVSEHLRRHPHPFPDVGQPHGVNAGKLVGCNIHGAEGAFAIHVRTDLPAFHSILEFSLSAK